MKRMFSKHHKDNQLQAWNSPVEYPGKESKNTMSVKPHLIIMKQ